MKKKEDRRQEKVKKKRHLQQSVLSVSGIPEVEHKCIAVVFMNCQENAVLLVRCW